MGGDTTPDRCNRAKLVLMELLLFDIVGEAVRSLAPEGIGAVQMRVRQWGIKVWFDAVKPTREHYEAQVIGATLVDDAGVLALEIGFHSEHPNEADNDAVIDRLVAVEKKWRRPLGKDATIDAFLGNAPHWRRISETWPDPDLSDPGMSIDIASRLIDYITVLEPLRRAA